jgi:hypothetical protein
MRVLIWPYRQTPDYLLTVIDRHIVSLIHNIAEKVNNVKDQADPGSLNTRLKYYEGGRTGCRKPSIMLSLYCLHSLAAWVTGFVNGDVIRKRLTHPVRNS